MIAEGQVPGQLSSYQAAHRKSQYSTLLGKIAGTVGTITNLKDLRVVISHPHLIIRFDAKMNRLKVAGIWGVLII